MSKSPYIPLEVKSYIEQYKIDDTLLYQKLVDSYTTFSQYFGKLSTPVIELEEITGLEILNNDEFKTIIQLIFTVQFKNYILILHYNFHNLFQNKKYSSKININLSDDEQKKYEINNIRDRKCFSIIIRNCEILTVQTNPELNEYQINQMNNKRIYLDYIYKPLYKYNKFIQ